MMVRYPVYLETGDDGRCMAHVVELPGCIARARSRDEALRQLPAAIADYHGWLRRHGEPAPSAEEPVEIELAGELTGYGPFERGDAAALFPPDRKPITVEEMEWHFRLLAHSRADLLALTQAPSAGLGQGLPDDILDWQPHPGSLSLRELLRHVGNADEWYVSRLVPPETLPAEWESDEDLPLYEFLEMSRRTAIARLRQLNQEERSGMFFPYEWTRHPQEPWTVRKALRRFLEHEREHTAQAREILAARRRWLLARLAFERARLLAQLLSLDEKALTGVPAAGDWTVKEVLAHIAAWDRWEARTMRTMAAGETPDWTAVQDIDSANAGFVASSRDRTLAEVLAEMQAARSDWVTWLERLPEEEFFRARAYSGHDWSFYGEPLRVQWQHDAGHAEGLAAWRKDEGLVGEVGPREVLLVALDGARQELLAAGALLPVEDRDSRPVCGEWTLQDLLGHIADWERLGADGLRQMAAGQPPQVGRISDFDAWNETHVEARRGQSWDVVWDDLHAARRVLLEVLGTMDEGQLAQTFPFPWGPTGTPYEWVGVYSAHDREHARDLLTWAGVVSLT